MTKNCHGLSKSRTLQVLGIGLWGSVYACYVFQESASGGKSLLRYLDVQGDLHPERSDGDCKCALGTERLVGVHSLSGVYIVSMGRSRLPRILGLLSCS